MAQDASDPGHALLPQTRLPAAKLRDRLYIVAETAVCAGNTAVLSGHERDAL